MNYDFLFFFSCCTKGLQDVKIQTPRNDDDANSDADPNQDDDVKSGGATVRSAGRKPAKGMNQFSFCDRATQTALVSCRSHGFQTETPPRATFNTSANAWIVYDAYVQDQLQKKIKSAGKSDEPASVLHAAAVKTDMNLSSKGLIRFARSAHIIERMLNQNSYDEIAQGTYLNQRKMLRSLFTPFLNVCFLDFKYWEDSADEFREPDGNLMPLWRFSPPSYLLRVFQENGIISNSVASHVTSLCWNPHYKDLFALGLGSRKSKFIIKSRFFFL